MSGSTQATFGSIIAAIIGVINSLVWLLSGIALLIFMWGMVRLVSHGADQKAYKEGKQLVLWGIISLFVIFSLAGIIQAMCANLLSNANACGIPQPINRDNIPT